MEESDFKTLNLYESDILFKKTFRCLIFGSSDSGKTHLFSNLIRLHHEKFHRIVISGAKNSLLHFSENRNKTVVYKPQDPIYNPSVFRVLRPVSGF